MKNYKKLILIILILLGGALRLWKLSDFPSGLTPDEAAQGYSAYSLLKTGRDEWGKSWPLNLRSYGDFKPPLQTYLMIPSIKLLGLNKIAVRLPNAFLGTLAVFGVFLFSSTFLKSSNIGILSAFLLAVSPWHWPLSRGAFEANLTVFFISFGLYFLLTNKQILAALFLGLNMFSYHSAKIITPLIICSFIIYQFGFRKNIRKNIKKYITQRSKFLILYTIFFIVAFSSFFIGGTSRGVDIAVFSPTDNWQVVKEARWWAVQKGAPDFFARLVHNKLTYTASKFVENYLSYFSPRFLFTEGPAEATYGMIPGYGVLGWWQLIILIFGLISVIKTKFKNNDTIVLLSLIILIAPFPAAITKGSRMANRAAVMMPFVQMLLAWSIWKLKVKSEKLKVLKLISIVVFFFFLFEFFHFTEAYFMQSPRLTAESMLYGRCQAVKYVQNNYSDAEQIIMSRKLSEPQAYVMFCAAYSPEKAQQETSDWLRYKEKGLSFVDQLGEYSLGKYIFKEINWASDSLNENSILIGLPEEFPYNTEPDKIIKYPNEKTAIYIVKV